MNVKMESCKLGFMLVIIGIVFAQIASADLASNQIYALDNTDVQRGKVLTLTVDPDSKKVGLQARNSSNSRQLFIARVNSDNTFNLFSNAQPWNWVDYIVERTKYVRITQTPQILGVIGATREVVEQNYLGRNANGQKWYLVSPTGSDPDTGVITNVQLRLCIAGQGENQPLTLAPCEFSDPNQIFKLAIRTDDDKCLEDD